MSRLTLIAMSLVMSTAGTAFANDGSKLIYDLTELGRHNPVFTSSEMLESHGAPQASPSPGATRTNPSDLSIDWSAGNLEVTHTRGKNAQRSGTAVHHTQAPDDQGGPRNATPNPEPGTLLLMGSGLVAGARSLRQRRNKSL